MHFLQDADSEVRKFFEFKFVVLMMIDVNWLRKIVWSDEVHFYINEYVNTHNF